MCDRSSVIGTVIVVSDAVSMTLINSSSHLLKFIALLVLKQYAWLVMRDANLVWACVAMLPPSLPEFLPQPVIKHS